MEDEWVCEREYVGCQVFAILIIVKRTVLVFVLVLWEGIEMKSVEDLDVFKLAHQLALKTYSTTKLFQGQRRLVSWTQMRRAATNGLNGAKRLNGWNDWNEASLCCLLSYDSLIRMLSRLSQNLRNVTALGRFSEHEPRSRQLLLLLARLSLCRKRSRAAIRSGSFAAFLLFLMARGFCLYVGIAGEPC